jgi:hypothetical protein
MAPVCLVASSLKLDRATDVAVGIIQLTYQVT